MIVEQLDLAFNPKSIAVVGASGNPMSMGYSFVEHLKNYGFKGEIYPVTPKWPDVLGYKAYKSLKDIPGSIDFVICCVSANLVLDLLKECSEKGVKVIHLFTGRFSESGDEEAAKLEQEVLRVTRELGIRMIGPNCMGVYNPEAGLSFGYDLPTVPGKLGMFLQSGGAAVEFIYYAALRGINFSKVVSYGNALDLDESDFLEYMANDDKTKLIASYIEGIKDGKKFIKTLKKTTATKPVIILKSGRGEAGAKAAASHTSAMGGSHQIWESAVTQGGGIQAKSLEDMIDLAVSFYNLPPMFGNRVGIVGGGGGKSVLSADEWDEAGFDVAPLPPEVEEMIRSTMPELWWGWIRNPLDISALPMEARETNLSGEILKMMAKSDSIDLVIGNMTVGGPFSKEMLAASVQGQTNDVIEAKKIGKNPVAVVLDIGVLSIDDFKDPRWTCLVESVSKLTSEGIPVYPNAVIAANSIIRLIDYYKRREAMNR